MFVHFDHHILFVCGFDFFLRECVYLFLRGTGLRMPSVVYLIGWSMKREVKRFNAVYDIFARDVIVNQITFHCAR